MNNKHPADIAFETAIERIAADYRDKRLVREGALAAVALAWSDRQVAMAWDVQAEINTRLHAALDTAEETKNYLARMRFLSAATLRGWCDPRPVHTDETDETRARC